MYNVYVYISLMTVLATESETDGGIVIPVMLQYGVPLSKLIVRSREVQKSAFSSV